jgi:exosortase C (VPDSG-CTERM-specific)
MTNQGTIIRRWLIAFLIAAVAFYRPLRELVRFAAHSELYSHVLLIPAICFYLVWTNRRTLPAGKPSPAGSLLGYLPALALLGWYFANPAASFWQIKSNYLSIMTVSLVLVCIGNLFLLLGKEFVSAALFPILFLFCLAPFPEGLLDGLETFFQHLSAWTAGILFDITGTTVLHDGLYFHLPGITLQVAQECSGIHSSLVLMLTALIAGYFFFSSCRFRLFLAFFVIPLGIVRNAFRIFVLGQLCIHVSPDMINTPIHHNGGPIFFALSLVPFFVLLHYLRKIESRKSSVPQANVSVVGK